MTNTRKITYSAVLAALAVISVVVSMLTNYPELMLFGSFCVIMAFDKCGVVFGFLTLFVSIALSAIFAWQFALIFLMLFGAYSVIFYFIEKIKIQSKPLRWVLRYAILLLFLNGILLVLYFFTGAVLFDIASMAEEMWGGALVLLLITNALFVVTDLLFLQLRPKLYKIF